MFLFQMQIQTTDRHNGIFCMVNIWPSISFNKFKNKKYELSHIFGKKKQMFVLTWTLFESAQTTDDRWLKFFFCIFPFNNNNDPNNLFYG